MGAYICVYVYIRIGSNSSRLFCIDLPVSSGYLDSITVNVIRRLSVPALVHRWKTVRASFQDARVCTYLIIIRITATLCPAACTAMYVHGRAIAIDNSQMRIARRFECMTFEAPRGIYDDFSMSRMRAVEFLFEAN